MELLVVIAIIGVLLGLLIPAVQAAREAARRTACMNNVKQIGAALLNYQAQYRRFPPGSRIVPRDFDPGVSWRVIVLPFLEEMSLYEQIEPLDDGGANNWGPKTRAVTVYVCPSAEPPIESGTNLVAAHYATVSGAERGSERIELGPCGDIYTNGIYYPDSETSPRDIVDGMSKTLAVGERLCKYRDWMDGAQKSGSPPTQIWTEASKNVSHPINSEQFAGIQFNDLVFDSSHPRGALFCLADGSVQFLRDSIDFTVFQDMATKNGE